jgi:hypothetical protein
MTLPNHGLEGSLLIRPSPLFIVSLGFAAFTKATAD